MSKIDFSQIYLQLEHEINRIGQTTNAAYRDAKRDDAKQVISFLKKDIENWVVKLNDRTIACYDLEGLLEGKKDFIELQLLEGKGVDEHEIEETKNDILRLIAKAIMNSYLDSLFKNQKRVAYSNDDLFLR